MHGHGTHKTQVLVFIAQGCIINVNIYFMEYNQ